MLYNERIPDVAIENHPKVLFETLPKPIRDQYHRMPLVHLYVSAFIYGKISREEMFENLALALLHQNLDALESLGNFCKWFGLPTTIES